MFNKSLFKQSCKANGTMWIIITIAVCFMLCCVMLIAGDDSLAETKTSIQNTIIEGELESQTSARAVNYFCTADMGLEYFDEQFTLKYNELIKTEDATTAYNNAYTYASKKLPEFASKIIKDRGIDPKSRAAEEITGSILMVFNPILAGNVHLFDTFYKSVGETAPRYDAMPLTKEVSSVDRMEYRHNYTMKNSTIFLAGNMVKEENISMVLSELQKYSVSREQYDAFGFTDYNKVKDVATESLINFRANYDYRTTHMKENETVETIVAELAAESGKSLLASLPQEVAEAIEEIGKADLYGIIVGSIFFKMAGLLLPIIYMIMTANALIAGQVDSGSMAYILSTSVKRRTVLGTQALFLIGSLFAMFTCTSIASVICLAIVKIDTSLTFGNILLINLGAFLVMFAMSGICFFASCWFNRSKHSMAIGGGLNMFFLVATMLGLFGSEIIPSIVRMDALNMFNYVSIISLFDVISILEGNLTYLWKFAILIVIGVIGYVAGSEKFVRKDLPL